MRTSPSMPRTRMAISSLPRPGPPIHNGWPSFSGCWAPRYATPDALGRRARKGCLHAHLHPLGQPPGGTDRQSRSRRGRMARKEGERDPRRVPTLRPSASPKTRDHVGRHGSLARGGLQECRKASSSASSCSWMKSSSRRLARMASAWTVATEMTANPVMMMIVVMMQPPARITWRQRSAPSSHVKVVEGRVSCAPAPSCRETGAKMQAMRENVNGRAWTAPAPWSGHCGVELE